MLPVGTATMLPEGNETVQLVYSNSLTVSIRQQSGLLALSSTFPQEFIGQNVAGLNGNYYH